MKIRQGEYIKNKKIYYIDIGYTAFYVSQVGKIHTITAGRSYNFFIKGIYKEVFGYY